MRKEYKKKLNLRGSRLSIYSVLFGIDLFQIILGSGNSIDKITCLLFGGLLVYELMIYKPKNNSLILDDEKIHICEEIFIRWNDIAEIEFLNLNFDFNEGKLIIKYSPTENSENQELQIQTINTEHYKVKFKPLISEMKKRLPEDFQMTIL